MTGPKGSVSARTRRTAPMATFYENGGGVGGLSGAASDSWAHVSSMGDLEALDTILDTLVVADPKMRQALLQGPLVSFETVVPEPKSRAGPAMGLDEGAALQDRTFNLTSVPGVVEEGMEGPDSFPPPPPLDESDMEAILVKAQQEQQEAERQAQEQQQQQLLLQQQKRELQQKQLLEGYSPEAPEHSTLRATAVVPVPILPKLARMYISSKQAGAAKAPPPPPPTAHWLVHSRPHPDPQAAPSYDTLCNQIRDVQRQYTCGTVRGHAPVSDFDHEPGRPPRINPNIGMYISGLDGPALDEVAQAQGLPPGLERSRPSFVAMQQSKVSSRRGLRSRSPGGGRSHKASFDQYIYRPDDSGPLAPWSAGAMQSTGEGLLDGDVSPNSD
eukprot:CAMPEP_0202344404 /NCGR_PEP_ID=MMETSP1126-20121109/4105_1 /ASSEMBLY_ACC=CAM_ASM_000457 /TAXON_ID=3047 /ORGANISM="Dunaliella tertiolecta, Strain CCMP1320" /LENGTH=385 /DNA_ID=CAMNT_0048935599 /DNA_START=689 /DNA_END=1846 /DNA_ORIENTATION=-